MFVLKTSAGFDLFKWIALAASDFLSMGGTSCDRYRNNIRNPGLEADLRFRSLSSHPPGKAGVFFWAESFSGYFAVGSEWSPPASLLSRASYGVENDERSKADQTSSTCSFLAALSAVIFFIAFINMMFYLGAMTWVIGSEFIYLL